MPDAATIDPYAEFRGEAATQDPYAEFRGPAAGGASPAPPPQSNSPSMLDSLYSAGNAINPVAGGALQALVGAGKGIASTGGRILNAGIRAFGGKGTLPTPQPSTPAEKLGHGVEQAGEYMVPGAAADELAAGALRTAPSMARILGRTIAQSGVSGAVGASQGGNLKSGIVPAVSGAIGGAIGAKAAEGVGPILKNVNTPEVKTALSEVQKAGVPLSAGQQSGSEFAQRVEQQVPGSRDFSRTQQAALSDRASDLSASVGTAPQDAYSAGSSVQSGVRSKIASMKSQADAAYQDARDAASANTVELPNTAKPPRAPAGFPNPGAAPPPLPKPSVMESPVDLAPMRQQLRPLYDELSQSLPVAQQQSSPAWAVLKSIMSRNMASDERFMPAMDFDRSLGAIKALTRGGNSPFLSNRSQGIAKAMVSSGEQQLANALPPDASAALQKGRDLVKQYYDAADLVNLQQEPAQLYRTLVSGKDAMYDTLNSLKKTAPDAVDNVARAFTDGLVQKATGEGGFQRSAGLAADWNNIGPRTKNLLFGPQTSSDIGNFLLAAKTLGRQMNPSGSAGSVAAAATVGAIGAAVTHIFTGDPAAAAGIFGTAVAAPALIGKIMFSPGGARMLTNVVKAPAGSVRLGSALAALSTFMRRSPAPSAPPTTNGPPPIPTP